MHLKNFYYILLQIVTYLILLACLTKKGRGEGRGGGGWGGGVDNIVFDYLNFSSLELISNVASAWELSKMNNAALSW